MQIDTQLSHNFDIHLQAAGGIDSIDDAVFNACEVELQRAASDCDDDGGDDGGFDCAGTLGTLGCGGGCFGSVGTFGCCC